MSTTLWKDGYGDVAADLEATGKELRAARERLLGLADADAAAAWTLFDAVEAGSDTERPDVMTGVFSLEGARRGAMFAVRTNAGFLEDGSFVADTERRGAELDDRTATALAGSESQVGGRLWSGRNAGS